MKTKKPAKKKTDKNKPQRGSKYHKVSKPLGGIMHEPNNRTLIELGSMKPLQRFMFPNGKATYTLKKFSPSNAAVYESDKGMPYKTQNLKIKVVLVS